MKLAFCRQLTLYKMATRSRRSLAAINNGNKPYIGRRTGKVIDINARLDEDGYERVSDYFPDTDSDSENDVSTFETTNDNNKSISNSKLNKSKHNISRRASRTEQNKSKNELTSQKLSNGSEISPDSAVGSADPEVPSLKIDRNDGEQSFQQEKPVLSAAKQLHKKQVSSPEKQVLSPAKQVSSPEKPVSSPEKPVSSPAIPFLSSEKQVSSQEKSVSSQEKSVSSPEKRVSSPEKQVSSPEKQVSSPEKQVSSPNEQALSAEKPVLSTKTQVSSPNKPVPPSDRQVLSAVRMPPASINCSKVMVDSSPEAKGNPGSTKKKLDFSFVNTSLIEEETHLDVKQSLLTDKQSNDPTEDDYLITDGGEHTRPSTKKATTKKSNKKTKPQQKSLEYEDNNDELLTQEVCKSNENTFLTLKKKRNKAEMLYKSTSSVTITTEDSLENSQLSKNNKTVSKKAQLFPETAAIKYEESLDNETTNLATTQKGTRSKIPVRKKRRPKLTFKVRSRRKASPKEDETVSQKARYRKTPGTKNTVRKTKTGDAGNKSADHKHVSYLDDSDNDIRNATITIEAADETTSSKPPTKPSLRKKVTRSRKQQELTEEEEKVEVENETSVEVQVKRPKGRPSTKKTSKIPLSTRSVNKRETSIPENNSYRKGANLRSPNADKTVQRTASENPHDNELTMNKSNKKNATKLAKNTRNKDHDQRNDSRESIETETDSESEKSTSPVDPLPQSPITSPKKITFSPLSDVESIARDEASETTIVARKRKFPAKDSVYKPNQTRGKRGTASKVSKTNISQGRAKAVKGKTAKDCHENSEKASGFSSDEEATSSTHLPTASGDEVFDGTESNPGGTVSETEDNGSTIKVPRNKKKRPVELDSVTNQEENDNISDGPRRSQRNRVPCLQFWKNDHIEYERRRSGFVVKKVIVNPTPAVPRRKRRADRKSVKPKSKKAMRETNSDEEESDLSDIEIPEGTTKETDPVATVIDPDTLREVDMKVLHSAENLELRSPSLNRDENNPGDAPLLVDKYFSHSKFGAGQILLRPGAEKGRQHVRRDTMIFHILTGRVLFSIHNQNFIVSKGSAFFVPQGNVYNLHNLDKKKDARLIFCQIKE